MKLKWIVPLGGRDDFEIVVAGQSVAIRRKVLNGRGLVATVDVETLTAMEATQLGMALCEAGREAGRGAGKRKAKR